MRVAVVHSFYREQIPSGENAIVEEEMRLLARSGHQPTLHARRSPAIPSFPYKLRAAGIVASGIGPRPDASLSGADVVHVHNLFPNFGRRWLQTCKAPIIVTLHNMRSICMAGTLSRDGHDCTACLDRSSSLPGLRYGCYGGMLASVPMSIMTHATPRNVLLDHAKRIIVLNSEMMNIYSERTPYSEKLVLIPNGLDLEVAGSAAKGRDWLYVGRISREKNLRGALTVWPLSEPLHVYGNGDDLEHCRRLAPQNVQFHGLVDKPRIYAHMRRAAGLIFPSRWAEGLPLTAIEALAHGLPILAWQSNSVAQLVAEHEAGVVTSGSRQDVLSSMKRISQSGERFGTNALAAFSGAYSGRQWIGRMTQLFDEVRLESSSR